MNTSDFLERLDGVKKAGNGWDARCPAHDDKRPSLGVLEGADGRIVLRCRAGCETGAVLAQLGLEVSDLFDEAHRPNGHRREVARYPYLDEAAIHLYDVVRWHPKDFSQEPANGRRGRGCMNGVRRVLYHLPDVARVVAARGTVWVCEGEKDADALQPLLTGIGAVATTNPGGASVKWRDEYTEALRGADVVIVADADEPGRIHAWAVADALAGAVSSIQVVEAAAGKDAHDHIAASLGLGDFVQVERDPQPAQRRQVVPGHSLHAVSLETIQMRSIEWIEKPLWQRSAFQLLSGAKGCGKGTYLALMGAKITTGLLPGGARSIVFVSSEDSAAVDLKPRLVAAGADISRCFIVNRHVRLPEDVDELRLIVAEIGGAGCLVLDPVANHIGDRNSNADAEVRDAIAPLNQLADDLDCLVIGVRHPGKDRSRGAVASILGSTAWVDTPRAVVMIASDDEDESLRHVQVVAGNRSATRGGVMFRIEGVTVDGLSEEVTRAVEMGASAKDLDMLLARPVSGDGSKTKRARELVLDLLEAGPVGGIESDTLDAAVAGELGVAAKTVKNIRSELRKAGLIRVFPELSEAGQPKKWRVTRTGAPRP